MTEPTLFVLAEDNGVSEATICNTTATNDTQPQPTRTREHGSTGTANSTGEGGGLLVPGVTRV